MDEVDTTTLASGSEAPATQDSETAQPSAANNYLGIYDPDKAKEPADAGQTEADASIQGDEADEGSDEDTQTDPWAGYVDFEYEGQTFKVPEALKDGYYRNKDYTQGKQALAEEKRAIEAQKEQLTRASQVSEQELNLKIELNGVVSQLQRYDQVDWDAFEQQDPLAAQSEFRKYQQLQQTANRKYGELQNAQTERTQIVERSIANRIAETTDFAYKNIPGMSPELDTKITEHAIKKLGYDPDTLKKSYNPQIYKTLFLAYLGSQTLENRSKPAAPKPAAQTKPLEVVSAKTGSSGRKSLNDLAQTDFEGYRAARNAQLAKARS